MFDQSGGGLAEHDATGQRGRFHPLGQSDLLTERGITQ